MAKTEMSLKECIAEFKEAIQAREDGRRFIISVEALSLAISKLSLLEAVEKGGVEKKIIESVEDTMKFPLKPNYLFIPRLFPSSGIDRMWQQDAQIRDFSKKITDLCNADLAKRLEGVEEVIDKTMPCECHPGFKDRGLEDPDCPNHNYKEDLVENITTCLTGKEGMKGKCKYQSEDIEEVKANVLIFGCNLTGNSCTGEQTCEDYEEEE